MRITSCRRWAVARRIFYIQSASSLFGICLTLAPSNCILQLDAILTIGGCRTARSVVHELGETRSFMASISDRAFHRERDCGACTQSASSTFALFRRIFMIPLPSMVSADAQHIAAVSAICHCGITLSALSSCTHSTKHGPYYMLLTGDTARRCMH